MSANDSLVFTHHLVERLFATRYPCCFVHSLSLSLSLSHSDNYSLAIMSVGGIGNQEKEADSAIHEACQKVKN